MNDMTANRIEVSSHGGFQWLVRQRNLLTFGCGAMGKQLNYCQNIRGQNVFKFSSESASLWLRVYRSMSTVKLIKPIMTGL